MATASVISICNRALGSISARANVQSLNEGSTESNACNLFFQSTFEALGRTAKWNCLEKQGLLTLISSAPGTPTNPQGATTPYPPTPWYYSYLLPSDCLFMRAVLPPQLLTVGSGTPIFPIANVVPYGCGNARAYKFKVALGLDKNNNQVQVVNTNVGGAQAIYTANAPNPQLWDSLFQQAMVASLSVFLCSSVSGDKAQAQIQKGTAEAMIANARAADGDEGTISQDHTPDWIAGRAGESGPWSLGFNTGFLNYDNMAWPW